MTTSLPTMVASSWSGTRAAIHFSIADITEGGMSILLPRRSRRRTGREDVVGAEGDEATDVTAAATAARSSGVHATTSAVRSPDSATRGPPQCRRRRKATTRSEWLPQRTLQRNQAHGEPQIAAGTPAHVNPHMHACASQQSDGGALRSIDRQNVWRHHDAAARP